MSLPFDDASPSPPGLATRFSLELPTWLVELGRDLVRRPFPSDRERMALAIDLARQNVERGSGGPFGAAVFASPSGRLVSVGVNLVVEAKASMAHAEVVALSLAQQLRGSHDLGNGDESLELFTSTEPCAMCLGSIPWSGIARVVCAATGEDAERIGFDEGAKPANWVSALEARGIRVDRELLRSEGRFILEQYAAGAGLIY